MLLPARPLLLATTLMFAFAASAHAVDPPTYEQLQGQPEQRINAKARALWEKLTPEDREAIARFLQESEDVRIFKPDIVAYLAQGRRNAAIKIVVDNYHLDAKRAAIVVDLIGYTNGLE